MGDSSGDSVSINMESTSFAGKEYIVNTSRGSVSVAVFGDQDKPALITYPDLGLNYMSCFQGLFYCPEVYSLLMHNFCIYHISPPGHEVSQVIVLHVILIILDSCSFLFSLFVNASRRLILSRALQLGAVAVSSDDPVLSVDDLADQISEVLEHFGLGPVMCMGVTAGAYILSLFAIKYPHRVKGLILISPICRTPSWTEWLSNKVMSNLLYFCGMCGLVTELLLKRYFSKEVRGSAEVPESDMVQTCRKLLAERQSTNVQQFLQAMNWRSDITNGLRKIKCHTLIFVGEYSPFHSEAMHMMSKLDRRLSALVEVQACGSIVTEEHPDVMLIPMEYFLMRYGCYRPPQNSVSPRSPLSPTRFSPELFTPESLGLNLKPIKTRMTLEV